jgi:hypothetical protein
MADLVEVPFDGGTLLFAAAGSEGAQAFSTGTVTIKATETFNEVLASVVAMGEQIARQISTLKCDSAEASFGIKFTGKGKFIVAEASAEASLTIKLVFKGA